VTPSLNRTRSTMTPAENSYIARICYNSHGWTRPSGDAWRHESGSFAQNHKYGHEEWLLDFTTLIDGWKFGSIEVGHPRRRLAGEQVDVFLYTIRPDKTRVLVGRINPCFVLTEDQAESAIKVFKSSGWLSRMMDEVNAVGGKLDVLRRERPSDIVTVKFRHEAYQPVGGVVAERGSWITERPRYQFMELPVDVRALWGFSPDDGAAERRTEPSERSAVESGPILYRHNEIQNRLAALLRMHYASVVMEVGHVDIRVEDPRLRAFIEVKATTDPRLAIREALGQLLEYALFGAATSAELPRLVVAAPGASTPTVAEYLQSLRSRFGLVVDYVQATPDILALPPSLAPQARS
jgi:hypothetical protein